MYPSISFSHEKPWSHTDQLIAETKDWLSRHRYTHLITLASNTSEISEEWMRDRLRQWDARVNRALYGPKWRKHYDELIWFSAFLEKPRTNPHWHLLLRFVGRTGSDKSGEFEIIGDLADRVWLKLMPSGSVNVQEINDSSRERVVTYVAKELWHKLQYNEFVTPDEFRYR